MRVTYALIAAFTFLSSMAFAQSAMDDETFKNDIHALYGSAKQGFKDIVEGDAVPAADGNKRFKTTMVINGAKDVYVSVDSEDSKTYVAVFEFKNLRNAPEKLEAMMALMLEGTSEFGLDRSKGTEIRYVGYRKHTVEFPSDNIDLMGKYPAYSLGILDDGNPVIMEMMITEPLWK